MYGKAAKGTTAGAQRFGVVGVGRLLDRFLDSRECRGCLPHGDIRQAGYLDPCPTHVDRNYITSFVLLLSEKCSVPYIESRTRRNDVCVQGREDVESHSHSTEHLESEHVTF
jgi:hypothetical protein